MTTYPWRRKRLPRVTCPGCGWEVSGRVPKDGDGTAWYPVWHMFGVEPCEGRFQLVTDTVKDGWEA
jgi:hypothetical protein